MLVKKEYERPIDTVQHLVEDGRPLYIAAKTSIFSALRDDSRESVQLIMKAQSKLYRFAGRFPLWVVESYVILELLFFMHINLNIACSVLNKTAVLVAPRTVPMKGVHKSKVPMFSVLNSFILPKGNPLTVIFLVITFTKHSK